MQQLQRKDTLSTLVSTANIATQQQSQQLAKAQHTLVKVLVQPVATAQMLHVLNPLAQQSAKDISQFTLARVYVIPVANVQMHLVPNLFA